MALVPVRSKHPDPTTGEHFESLVDEEWLTRWPDDFERIEPDTEAPADETPAPTGPAEVEAETPAPVAVEDTDSKTSPKRLPGTDPSQSTD